MPDISFGEMNRFRKQTVLVWFCLFSCFFPGLGAAEGLVLCLDEHHVKVEVSDQARCVDCVPFQTAPLNIDDHCADCIDVPISIGVSENPSANTAQADNPDFSISSFSELSFEKTADSRCLSKLSAKDNSILVSLGSIILLI